MKLYFIKYKVSSYRKSYHIKQIKVEERTKLLDLIKLEVRNIENYLKEYEENHIFNNERVVTKIELINFNPL